MEQEFYIIKRGHDFEIISCSPGDDPLFGYGSWDLAVNQHFDSYEAASSYLNSSSMPSADEGLGRWRDD